MVKIARDRARAFIAVWFLAMVIGMTLICAGLAFHIYGAFEGNIACAEAKEGMTNENMTAIHGRIGEWIIVKGQLVDKTELAFNFMMNFNYKIFTVKDSTGHFSYPVTDYEYERFKVGEYVKARFRWNNEKNNYDYVETQKAIQSWLPWSFYILGLTAAGAGGGYYFFVMKVAGYRMKFEKTWIAVYEKKEE